MIARRVPRGGSGGFTPPPRDVFQLVAAPGGWWSGIPDPVAYRSGGATYFGWADGSGGDVVAASYDHTAQTVTPFVLHAALQVDIHISPAVMVRPDGHVLAAYSVHDGASIIRRISTNADDVSAWGSEATGGGSDFTYMSFAQLLDVTNDPIWWMYRRYDGTGHLDRVISTDGLATWSTPASIVDGSSGQVPYWRIGTDWSQRIHVFITDTDRSDATPSSVYHFYIEGSSAYKSDGTLIAASGSWPFAPTAATLVKNASGGPVEPSGVCIQADGKPAGLLSTWDSGLAANVLSVARWTGSAWQVDTVSNTVSIPATALRHNTLGAIDPTNPDLVYMTRAVSGVQELFRCRSDDSGATWNLEQLTSGSAHDNLQPQIPQFATALKVIWVRGTYTGPGFSMAIMGLR